ncbi:MAG: glucosaminidase domain-containing protein [Chitinophagales bacterium]|jgi:flagellum-specific peptidoglycan hydrolase FlgJ
MVAFLSKHWFYLGLLLLGLIYFRRELLPSNKGTSTSSFPTFAENKTREVAELGISSGSTTMVSIFPEVEEQEERAFLKRFSKVVQTEQTKYGIPASVLLALAYVNSFSGQRALTRTHHNYFALQCGSGWEGKKVEIGTYCYRKYETAWESFRNASSSISATRWAQALVNRNASSEDWLGALVENGYSDVRDAQRLMSTVILRYQLEDLDGQEVP